MDILTLAMAKAYTDSQRSGYIERVTDVLVPEQSTTFWENVDYAAGNVEKKSRLVIGEEYIVVIDGVSHKAVAKRHELALYIYLGNYSIVDPELAVEGETEPFAYIDDVLLMDRSYINKTVTLSIVAAKPREIIHTIDPKLLPEGGFGYEETKIIQYDVSEYINRGVQAAPAPFIPVEGKEYRIILNSATNYSWSAECWEHNGRLELIDEDEEACYYIYPDGTWQVYLDEYYEYENFIIDDGKEIITHPIDPKYLPPVDSITMNGADGKQYKLTVSGGALNIAEVV